VLPQPQIGPEHPVVFGEAHVPTDGHPAQTGWEYMEQAVGATDSAGWKQL
jgi:hypothetical protein